MTISMEPKSVRVRLNLDKLPIQVQGEKVSNKFGSVIKLSVALAIVASMLTPFEAIAVTYGNPVSDPLSKAPYVVSVWKSDRGDVQQAEFICSGTLISSNIVLTAAHCTDFDNSSFFVKVGAVALGQEIPLYPATPWTGTRYDPQSIDGDIGLLRLNTTVSGITFPSLANAAIAKQISTKTQLTLMGWGRDQNKKKADTLHFSNLLLQDSASKISWGKYFNVKTMISAGKYIKNERKWSGSCDGDSGGPLLATFSGITYVVGVTSWGAIDCRIEKPSVFSRVSYFEKDIRAGIKAVELLAGTVNRLAPIEVVAPSMMGDGTPGTPMTCDVGKWENVVSLSIEWLSPSRMVGITSASTKIISADAGQEFKCRIVARSKSGSSETSVVRVVSKKLVKKLSVASAPVIGGLQGSEIVAPGTVARCEAWNWAEPVDSERVEWFTTSVSNPTTPINGKLIGSGSQLTLTEEILKTERGRYLVCQLTGMRDGFPNYLAATKFLASPNAPIISDVSVRASSLKSGSQATCSYASNSTTDSATYEWGYTGAGNAFTPFGGQNADFIQLNANILKTASGQKLACKVTLAYQGVTSMRIGTSVDIFESALEAPKVSISIPSNLYSGSSATCSVPYNSKYLSTTYEWGISNSPQSSFFISGVLSRGSTFTFDTDALIKSAGNYLICVVTVENDLGKAQGFSSTAVSLSAAPSLPTISAPVLSSQTKTGPTVTASISIPSLYSFNNLIMEAFLVMPGTSCDGLKITSMPMNITCGQLLGNQNYSVGITLRYLGNSSIPNKTSPATAFQTLDTTAAPSISISNPIQSVSVNTPIQTVLVTNTGGSVQSNGYSISPQLPSGISFNANSGQISGAPLSTQSQRNYTITATGPGGSSTATFTLTVLAPAPAPAISLSNSSMSVTVNNAISTISVSNSGGTVNSNGYSISPSLPTGMSFNTGTGSVTGTPTVVQSQTSYTITATGPGGSSSATFTLTVNDSKSPVIILNSVVLSARMSASDPLSAVTFRATDDTGISNAYVRVFNSNNTEMGTYLATRSSGTPLDGTYTTTYYYDPIFYPTGNYQVKVQLFDLDGKILDWQAIGTVSVTAPADTQNPVVVPSSATYSSPNARLGSSIEISFQANDNRGISSSVVALMDGAGNSLLWAAGALSSGLAIGGTFKATISIPSNFRVGGYIVCATVVDGSNLRSANQCGSRAEYVQIGVLEVVDPNSIYFITGWDAAALNGTVIPINRGGTWQIATLDHSKTFVTGVVARSDSGSPDIVANSFWKSRSEYLATAPDNWQAGFSVPEIASPGSLYKIYWTIKKSDGSVGTYSGGYFTVGN